MIIKSMARKQPSFGQLIAYMDRDANGQSDTVLTNNLYGYGLSARAIEAEFLSNHSHLPKRKNGNALFHEVLVLEQNPSISRTRQSEILKGLAREYLNRRAPDHLAFGRIHHNTDHAHIHLMISSNSIRSSSRKRLSRARFAEIQREIEQLALTRFPELTDAAIYSCANSSDRSKTTSREAEQMIRTKNPSKKQIAKAKIERALRYATNESELDQYLRDAGFKLYKRGKQLGVQSIDGNKRHRLSTLGLSEAFRDWQQQRQAVQATPPKPTPSVIPLETTDPRTSELLKARQRTEKFAEQHLEGDWDRS